MLYMLPPHQGPLEIKDHGHDIPTKTNSAPGRTESKRSSCLGVPGLCSNVNNPSRHFLTRSVV